MSKRMSLKGAVNMVVRGHTERDLVFAILNWWPHAEKEHAGKIWIAKRRRDWQDEIVCSSLRTLDRALHSLRGAGLIETCQQKFAGVWMLWCMPTGTCIQAVMKHYGKTLKGPIVTPSSAESDSPGSPEMATPVGNPSSPEMATPVSPEMATLGSQKWQPLYKETVQLKDTNGQEHKPKAMHLTAHCETGDNLFSPEEQVETVHQGVVKNGNPHEAGKPPKGLLHFNKSLSGCMTLWRKEAKYILPFTEAERKAIKRFYDICPPFVVGAILVHAIEHWPEITKKLQGIAVPPAPALGILADYAGVFIDHWAQCHSISEIPSAYGVDESAVKGWLTTLVGAGLVTLDQELEEYT